MTTTISRRTALGAIAALPAAVASGTAFAGSDASAALPIPEAVSDPLLAAIEAYRRGSEAYELHPGSMDDDEENAAVAATWGPPLDVLENWDRPATTAAGALAALRLAVHEEEQMTGDNLSLRMLEAALAFFEGEGGQR